MSDQISRCMLATVLWWQPPFMTDTICGKNSGNTLDSMMISDCGKKIPTPGCGRKWLQHVLSDSGRDLKST